MGLKSENVDFSLVLQAFFKAQRGDEYSKEVLQRSGRSGFGVFWGHFGVTLGSLRSFYVCDGCFGVTLVRFQDIHTFPTDCNDFVQVWK